LRDDWTLFGAPTVDQGLELNGTTQYATRAMSGEGNSAEVTVEIEFYPDFASTDGVMRIFCDLNDTGNPRLLIRKDTTNTLQIFFGNTVLIFNIAAVTLAATWLVGERNLLTVAGTSGSNDCWLNGVLLGHSATAWLPENYPLMTLGSKYNALQPFDGKITDFRIGHYLATEQEHIDRWLHQTWNWENLLDVNLQMRTGDYDPVANLTLDSSGHGTNFTLGNGAGANEPVQGKGRMAFAGAEYLRRGSVAQPAGSFTVAVTASSANTASQYVAEHHVSGTNFLMMNNLGRWYFYVGGTGGNLASSMPAALPNVLDPHTYVGVWDGVNTLLYVDGKAMIPAVTPTAPSGGTHTMAIGRRAAAASNYFTGEVFDYKYRDGQAWTPTQVQDYHRSQMAVIGHEL